MPWQCRTDEHKEGDGEGAENLCEKFSSLIFVDSEKENGLLWAKRDWEGGETVRENAWCSTTKRLTFLRPLSRGDWSIVNVYSKFPVLSVGGGRRTCLLTSQWGRPRLYTVNTSGHHGTDRAPQMQSGNCWRGTAFCCFRLFSVVYRRQKNLWSRLIPTRILLSLDKHQQAVSTQNKQAHGTTFEVMIIIISL